MPRPGGKWLAVRGVLQFADLNDEGTPRLHPASF